MPLICTILWKRRNSESCDSPARIETSNDITQQHILEAYTIPGFPACVCPKLNPVLSAQSDFAVAIATVNRSITAGFEGDLGVFTALGTCCRKHLALESIVATSMTLWFPCLAARGTALRLINIASGLEELLFLSAEGEGSPTIGTLERFVLKTHWMISSLSNFS